MRHFLGFTFSVLFSGWTAVVPSPAQTPAPVRAAAAEALPASFRPPDLKSASPEERARLVEGWQKRNEARFEARQKLAQEAVPTRPRAAVPMIRQLEIPESASPAMEEFLVQRTQMRNERVKLANTLRDATPEERAAAIRQWQDRQAPAQRALQQQAEVVAAESQQELLPMPSPLRVPDGISPELREFLVQRRASIAQFVEQENGVRRLPPAQQAAARHLLRREAATREVVPVPSDTPIFQPASTISITL